MKTVYRKKKNLHEVYIFNHTVITKFMFLCKANLLHRLYSAKLAYNCHEEMIQIKEIDGYYSLSNCHNKYTIKNIVPYTKS